MDLEIEIKEEPVWREGTASTSFDSYELSLDEMYVKEEIKSELAEPGQTQHAADIKDEGIPEEQIIAQLLPCIKEENRQVQFSFTTQAPHAKFKICHDCRGTNASRRYCLLLLILTLVWM
ncbi:uncharacterized protein [Anabrus simplex]|uniref:uncharacterized protein n=1 Tax=Anabrus simplex TaxID=316456 RepID=UPI0035A397B2